MTENQLEFLYSVFRECNLPIDSEKAEKLFKYYMLFTEKNKVMNLTAITEFEQVCVKHFADSGMLLKYIDMERLSKADIIDVGTGAGFPGIPLKILCPEMSLTLLDSLRKRVDFLWETCEKLELKGANCIHARAEDGAGTALRESFDFAVSRAVANLSVLSEYCLPYVKVGGNFIAYKSGDIEKEIKDAEKAIRILGGCIEKTEKFTLPFSNDSRSLVFVKKIRETEKKYPRKAGIPSKEPLS